MAKPRFARGLAASFAMVLVTACATVPAPPTAAPRLTVTDYTDDFSALYDASSGDANQRLAQINAGFADKLPGFYDPSRFGDRAEMYRRLAAGFLAAYPSRRAEIASVAARFTAMFDPAVADFNRRVGSLPTDTPVDLVVSLGEFDGATRSLNGRTHLMFGADMIALLHPGGARAFVQHELFHLYHAKRMDECRRLYCDLWREGLAVYAAQVLNPSASDAELLLTIPQPIRPALEANRREAVCETLARLDSTDGDDRNAFFSSGRLNPRLPPRFGYLVGAWVAADLGKTHSLAQLASLNGTALRAAIETSLRTFATCE